MIASITFTYGNDRMDIFKYKQKDHIDKLLRSSLDFNLYMFHNSSEDYIKQVKNSDLLEGFNLKFGSIEGLYPQALKKSFELLKKRGIKKIVFLQDDVFSTTKNKNHIIDLIDFFRKTNLQYLNLEQTFNDSSLDVLYNCNSFKILKADSNYFRKKNMWSFDDAPYFADLDFAINEIYDDTYFNYPDIWSAEWYLKAKFDQKNIDRPVTSTGFFRRVNFLGKNDWNRDNELIYLNNNFA